MDTLILPKRIQRTRQRGYKMPEGAVYVGRPTRWGNPFKIGHLGLGADWAVNTYRLCVSTFPIERASLEAWRAMDGDVAMLVAIAGRVEPIMALLRGHDLACWCPLDQPCHADVLLQLANEADG